MIKKILYVTLIFGAFQPTWSMWKQGVSRLFPQAKPFGTHGLVQEAKEFGKKVVKDVAERKVGDALKGENKASQAQKPSGFKANTQKNRKYFTKNGFRRSRVYLLRPTSANSPETPQDDKNFPLPEQASTLGAPFQEGGKEESSLEESERNGQARKNTSSFSIKKSEDPVAQLLPELAELLCTKPIAVLDVPHSSTPLTLPQLMAPQCPLALPDGVAPETENGLMCPVPLGELQEVVVIVPSVAAAGTQKLLQDIAQQGQGLYPSLAQLAWHVPVLFVDPELIKNYRATLDHHHPKARITDITDEEVSQAPVPMQEGLKKALVVPEEGGKIVPAQVAPLVMMTRSADKKNIIMTSMGPETIMQRPGRLHAFLTDWSKTGYIVIMNKQNVEKVIDAVQTYAQQYEQPQVDHKGLPILLPGAVNQEAETDEFTREPSPLLSVDFNQVPPYEDDDMPDDDEFLIGPWIEDEQQEQSVAEVLPTASEAQTDMPVPGRRAAVGRAMPTEETSPIALPKGITFKKQLRKPKKEEQKNTKKEKKETTALEVPTAGDPVPALSVQNPTSAENVTPPAVSSALPTKKEEGKKGSLFKPFNKDDMKKDLEAMRQAWQTKSPPAESTKVVVQTEESATMLPVDAHVHKEVPCVDQSTSQSRADTTPRGVYRSAKSPVYKQVQYKKAVREQEPDDITEPEGMFWPLLLLVWQWIIQAGAWFVYTKKAR